MPNRRRLYILNIVLDSDQENRISQSMDNRALEWFQWMGVLDISRQHDRTSPLLILRHDCHYERYPSVDTTSPAYNTGFIKPWLEYQAFEHYLDALIEGSKVHWGGHEWDLAVPKQCSTVINAAGTRYSDYFEARERQYE